MGAYLLGASILLFIYNIAKGLQSKEKAGPNPWDAGTLEWVGDGALLRAHIVAPTTTTSAILEREEARRRIPWEKMPSSLVTRMRGTAPSYSAGEIEAFFAPGEYLSFFVKMVLAFGLAFELPVDQVVVCAGAKVVLDLPATRNELMEMVRAARALATGHRGQWTPITTRLSPITIAKIHTGTRARGQTRLTATAVAKAVVAWPDGRLANFASQEPGT